MATPLLDELSGESRAFLEFALRRRTRAAAVQAQLRAKARTPKIPTVQERALEKILLDIARRINEEIRKALAGDLEKARAKATRQDADLAGLFTSRIFQDLEIRLARIVQDPRLPVILDQWGRQVNAANGQEMERVIGINPVTVDPQVTQALLLFRRASVDLIGSISQDQLASVLELVNQAANSGMRVETLAKRLEERYRVTRSRARLIARDQTLKTNADLSRLRQERVGVTRYRWSTSRDDRVRDHHRRLEGTVHDYSDPPVTNDQGDRNNPGEDYQCRCVAVPILPE